VLLLLRLASGKRYLVLGWGVFWVGLLCVFGLCVFIVMRW